LLTVINDILDFSKIEAGRLELKAIAFDLYKIIESTAESLAVKAHEKNIEFNCHISPKVPQGLIGDPGCLRQILYNLGGNAIKFTEKGEVNITCSLKNQGNSRVQLHFSISDSGIGIPPDMRERIFESFEQVDGSMTRKHSGTGLGLSISKRLVELMQGRIWVESEVGRGSAFYFEIEMGLDPDTHRSGTALEKVNIQGKRVLVVDDNHTNREILYEMLTRWSLDVQVAASGKEAIACMQTAVDTGKPLHLVLVDAQMPEMDGFQVSAHIKEDPRFKSAIIIMVTSMGLHDDSKRCQEIGVEGYMVKPLKQSELLAEIQRILGLSGRDKGEDHLLTSRAEAEQNRVGNLHILLAEDNAINRQMTARILEKSGHHVSLATNGQEALNRYAQKDFDLILMDIQMPVMDGWIATCKIREAEEKKDRRIPIIAMTAHAFKGDRERCLDAGMDDYLTKPIDPDELKDILRKWSRADRSGHHSSD
jgi:CheY-like chemotaxis protein